MDKVQRKQKTLKEAGTYKARAARFVDIKAIKYILDRLRSNFNDVETVV